MHVWRVVAFSRSLTVGGGWIAIGIYGKGKRTAQDWRAAVGLKVWRDGWMMTDMKI